MGVAADYTLTVTNNGTGPAASATVTDLLPANLHYNDATGATCTAAGQVLTCTVPGPIAPGGGTAAFTINVTPTAAGSAQNMATVDPTGGTTPSDPTDCTATGTPAGCAVPPAQNVDNGVNLSLAKTNPGSMRIGQSSMYTLIVTNHGTQPATSAHITDALTANISYDSATGIGWACIATGQTVSCVYTGSIAAGGGTSVLQLAVTPQAGANDTDVQNAATTGVDGGPSGDPSTCTATGVPAGCAVTPPIHVPTAVALSLVKANPATLTVGASADYSFTVTNSGLVAAASATVIDVLPANISYGHATGAACVAAGQTLTCAVPGPIAPNGGTVDFTITVTPLVAAGGTNVQNRAAVDPTGGSDPADPTGCVATGTPAGCAVPPAQLVTNGVDLGLVKKNPASLAVGVPADYTLTVTNNGTGPAASATVRDILPDGLVYNSAAGATCTAAGRILTCTVAGPIAPNGGTREFTTRVTASPAAAGASVRNHAMVASGGTSGPMNPDDCTENRAPANGCAVSPVLAVSSVTTQQTTPPPPVPPTGSAGPTSPIQPLASTGVPTWRLLGLGLWAVLAGTVLLAAARGQRLRTRRWGKTS